MPAYERRQRIEHQRSDDATFQLAHPHVLECEARMIGVELAPLLQAVDAIRLMAKLGEQVHVGATRRAIAERGQALRSNAHSRSSRVSWNTASLMLPRTMPGPWIRRPWSVSA